MGWLRRRHVVLLWRHAFLKRATDRLEKASLNGSISHPEAMMRAKRLVLRSEVLLADSEKFRMESRKKK